MTIFIPGGHLTPALGLIDWIQDNHPHTKIVFAGRVYSQETLKQLAIEAYEVNKRGVTFIPAETVKFDQNNLTSWVFKPVAFLLSLIKAISILDKQKPDVIMSFGGYVAVPFVIAGWLKRIPILAHEGTRVVGLANKIIFLFSSKIAYSFPDFSNYELKKIQQKAVLTGSPLRSIIKNQAQASLPDWLDHYQSDQKILLVLGGNQGSKTLNDFIALNLQELSKKYLIVHQCGRPNKLYNYQQELMSVAQEKQVKKDQYHVLPWIDEQDLVWLYQHAGLVLSRAGVNTIEELIHYTVPAVLVPLPSAHFNEQLQNAQYLAKNNSAIVLEQKDLSLESFERSAQEINSNRQRYIQQLNKLKLEKPNEPAENIFKILTALVK